MKSKQTTKYGLFFFTVLILIVSIFIWNQNASKTEYGDIDYEETTLESETTQEEISRIAEENVTFEEITTMTPVKIRQDKEIEAYLYDPIKDDYYKEIIPLEDTDFLTAMRAINKRYSNRTLFAYIKGGIGVLDFRPVDFLAMYEIYDGLNEVTPINQDSSGVWVDKRLEQRVLVSFYETAIRNYKVRNIQVLSYGKPLIGTENGFIFDTEPENMIFDEISEYQWQHLPKWEVEGE